MAGASLFLPMLPTQILLNNFLYDLAQITIPTDSVDANHFRNTALEYFPDPQFHDPDWPDQFDLRSPNFSGSAQLPLR